MGLHGDGVKLATAFFARSTLTVARELLGHRLVRKLPDGQRVAGRIVESEGYTADDPAFRGWGIMDPGFHLVKPEGRGFDLFRRPGTAYVYRVHVYWMLNVVTERDGVPGCVLIRAVEPEEGLALMWTHRPSARREPDLTSGPGKLTLAFGIDKSLHGSDLTKGDVFFEMGIPFLQKEIGISARIGLRHGADLPRRFYALGNRYVSPGKPGKLGIKRHR